MGFRVTEEEQAQIRERMKDCGISSVRAFLLKMALNGMVIQLDLTEVREMTKALRAIGTNVNQIARRANESRYVYAADIADIQARLNGIWERLDKLVKTLSEVV